jgi:hypothetical protein
MPKPYITTTLAIGGELTGISPPVSKLINGRSKKRHDTSAMQMTIPESTKTRMGPGKKFRPRTTLKTKSRTNI